MTPIKFSQARIHVLGVMVALYLSAIGILLFSKISIDPSQAVAAYGSTILPCALAIYARARGMKRLEDFLHMLIACLLCTIPLTVLSYFAMSLNMPLADGLLMRLDRGLGFDWMSVADFVDQRPLVATMSNIAYQTFAYQLLTLPLWHALASRQTDAAALIFSFALFGIGLSAIAAFFPAVGAYAHLDLQPNHFQNLDSHYGYFFLPEFHAVRQQSEFVLKLQDAAGILTFPSGHAGTALLLAWCAWSSRSLRYPMLGLNILMAFSAITNGGHYLVDVLAGLGLAGVAIFVTSRVFYHQTESSVSTSPESSPGAAA